jgi:3-oxoacyl-[acyl-carrier protein] reductase
MLLKFLRGHDMLDLSGKIALITGASGGIGSETARLFHKLGASVILSGTNMEKLQDLQNEIGDNCFVKAVDLSDHEACEHMLDDIEKLDILVCNAGITSDNLVIRMGIADFERVIDVNLTSTFILNKIAARKMMSERYGRIINISSVVAFTGNPGQVNYCASKAGIIGMTKALALEIAGRGVTVNAVAPGFIKTNMTDKLNEKQVEYIMSKIPLARMGEALDIASAIAFLASDMASYVTGQTLHINGGMYS